MKNILLLITLISSSAISQSIGINDLFDFKSQSIGQIEEKLIINDWVMGKTYENNFEGILALQGNSKIYTFKKEDYYGNELATISITINSKRPNEKDIKYSTESSELNKSIVLNLKRYGFEIIDTGPQFFNMNFNPKVGDIMVEDSFGKTYSNGSREVLLTTEKLVKVVAVDYENYYTKEYKTLYKLSL